MIFIKEGVMIVDPVVKGRFKETYEFLNGLLIDKEAVAEVFCKKGVLRNFAKFTEKQLCQSLFF